MEKFTKVTKESMKAYIALRKRYEELRENGATLDTSQEMKDILKICNNFIDNVINKDKEYYTKLSSYGFSNDDLQFCM